VLEALEYVGVLTIEFFVYDGQLYANEFAPRVHNSGHMAQDYQYQAEYYLRRDHAERGLARGMILEYSARY